MQYLIRFTRKTCAQIALPDWLCAKTCPVYIQTPGRVGLHDLYAMDLGNRDHALWNKWFTLSLG